MKRLCKWLLGIGGFLALAGALLALQGRLMGGETRVTVDWFGRQLTVEPLGAYAGNRPSGTPDSGDTTPRVLVEETLERYVTLFHLCDCPRCLADAQALALSRLPAKYVVLSESAFTPMMSLYRAKYDSIVTTQVVYACKQIMDAPRH